MAVFADQWLLERCGDSRALDLRATFVSNDHYALRDVTRAGAGIAAMPCFLAAPDVANGTLTRVLSRWSLPPGKLALLWPTRRHMSPRVRAFIDLAVEFFDAERGRLRGTRV